MWDSLDGAALEAEPGGGLEHVAVAGPDFAFSDFVGGGEVNGVGGAYEEIGRSGDDQCACSPQQSFGDGNQVPETRFDVFGEAGGYVARVGGRQEAFAQAAVDYAVELRHRPEGRAEGAGFSNQFSNPRGFGFVEIELSDVGGVEIHGALAIAIFFDDPGAVAYRWHSSPDFLHRAEDERFRAGRHGQGRG